MKYVLGKKAQSVTKSLSFAVLLASLAACQHSGGGGGSSAPSSSAAPSGSVSTSNLACVVAPHIVTTASNSGPTSGASGQAQMKSHIPHALRHMKDVGTVSEAKTIPLMIDMGLNNEADLERQLVDIYTPGSAHFHQFISPQDFRARYAPSEAQIAQVQAHLQKFGITSSLHENGLFLRAEGNVRGINAAFQTELHHYHDPKSGKLHYAPSTEPQVPAGVPILGVHGLDNLGKLKPHSVSTQSNPSFSGNGPWGGLAPADIRKAYEVPNSVTGTGQTLALMELDGYNPTDIAHYEQNFGLRAVPLQNILVDGATGGAGANALEVVLDIELMIALAPGANKIMVYEGPNSGQGLLDTYARIANDNIAKSVSTSWGLSENLAYTAFFQSENAIFRQMAVQGQSVFAAAGDNAANDNGSSLSVDDPAAQPYVTGVGGTRLLMTATGAYQTESVWNWGNGVGGGGGTSAVWSQPFWQSGLANAQNLGSSTRRNVPDVALNADPDTGYSVYINGVWQTVGGTSAAAPLWAAFTALVNQQRAANGLGTLGFANPILYGIGRGTNYHTDFHDTSDTTTNGHFPAVSGYDNSTGWGSFKGQELFNDLSVDLPADPNAVVPVTSPGC